MHSTSRVLVCIVQLCFKSKDWNALNEHIVILTKRRSQLKQVEIFQYLNCISKVLYSVLLDLERERHFDQMFERRVDIWLCILWMGT